MTEFQPNTRLSPQEPPCVIEPVAPRWPGFERPPKPELVALGWERRFMADGARLAEYLDLYQSLGYEVYTEKIAPDEIGAECADCRLIICRQFVTLYTRKP